MGGDGSEILGGDGGRGCGVETKSGGTISLDFVGGGEVRQ